MIRRSRAGSLVGGGLGFVLAYLLVTALLPSRSEPVRALAPGNRSALSTERHEAQLLLPEVAGAGAAPAQASAAATASESSETSALASSGAIGVVLHGVVRDPAGEPLEEASVWLQRADGERMGAQTDERGRYSLGILEPGTQRVHATKIDYHEGEADLALHESEPLRRQDFELRPKQRIRVRVVTSAGAPTLQVLSEAGLHSLDLNLVPVATRADPGPVFTEVHGSLNNPFGISSFWQNGFRDPALGPEVYGIVTLHEDGPAWLALVAAHQVLRKQQVDPATEEVTFVIDPIDVLALRSSLHAVLRDANSREPLAGRVWLADEPFPNGPALEVGPDGVARMEDVWPGMRWFVAEAEGRARVVRSVTLLAGQRLELGEILLPEPVALRGHARRSTGEPVQAVIRWGRLDPGSNRVAWAQQFRAQSGPDGRFALEGLEPGVWVLVAPGLQARSPRPFDGRMASMPLKVDATVGSVEDLELVLQATTTITLVTKGVVEPWPYAIALDPAGLPAGTAWPGRYGDETPLQLVPGRYVLIVEREGIEVERRTLTVGEAPQRVELSLR